MNSLELDGRASSAYLPAFGRLLVVELRRICLRRFTKVLLTIVIVCYLAIAGYAWFSFSKVDPTAVAEASVARDQHIRVMQQAIDQCLTTAGPNSYSCGTAPSPNQLPIELFLSNKAFSPSLAKRVTLAIGILGAVGSFLLAATFIGAEWSTKNMVGWLLHEPRRTRLLGAKALAITVFVATVSAVVQLAWMLTSWLLINERGTGINSDSAGSSFRTYWSESAATDIRAGLAAIATAWVGFGLANVARSTAACLGIAFCYIAIIESAIRWLTPSLQPYMFSNDMIAWISQGGLTLNAGLTYNQRDHLLEPAHIYVSTPQGGLVLVVYGLTVLAVAFWTFRRRDTFGSSK